ncbi:hypothetical protein MATL_G00194910 [Megalops atlanticus]|uniref:Uncharacterized protein n=1 Tax=Megalops atlanticus TaxID=7932 RepID=A0A9D3PLL7_MEGAT|nr:hypothetical protein MATL_G00194910 [Megalops atlanticus]
MNLKIMIKVNTMRPMTLMICLLGCTVGRPSTPQNQRNSVKNIAKPKMKAPYEMTSGHPVLFPLQALDQAAQQIPPEMIPQFISLDPANPLYQHVPFLVHTPQLQFLSPDQQIQSGPILFPTTQLRGPLADTDVQQQVYTLIIQQSQTSGSASSEEGAQQPVIYSGVLTPVVPESPNMGITNGGVRDRRRSSRQDGQTMCCANDHAQWTEVDHLSNPVGGDSGHD